MSNCLLSMCRLLLFSLLSVIWWQLLVDLLIVVGTCRFSLFLISYILVFPSISIEMDMCHLLKKKDGRRGLYFFCNPNGKCWIWKATFVLYLWSSYLFWWNSNTLPCKNAVVYSNEIKCHIVRIRLLFHLWELNLII